MQISLEPNTKPMPLKWHMLLAVLPKFDWNITAAATSEEIGYSKRYAEGNLPAILNKDSRFCEALAERKANLAKQCDIEVIEIQHELLTLARTHAQDKPSAAVAAYNAILKTIGGFMADKLPDENLMGKVADAKKAEALRKIADLYYADRYLALPAVRAIEATMVVRPNEEDAQAYVCDNLSPEATMVDNGPDGCSSGCSEEG